MRAVVIGVLAFTSFGDGRVVKRNGDGKGDVAGKEREEGSSGGEGRSRRP